MADSPLANLQWDALRLRWSASPWPQALRNAHTGLLDLLPASLRSRWFPPTRRLWLRVENDALHLMEEAGPERTSLGALPLNQGESAQALMASLERRGIDGELWLALPAAQGLVRSVSLPLAAEAQLAQVMRHEVDRQTPFSADQVVFSAQVLSRNVTEGQLRAELAVVPRAALDATLASLGPLAARLSGADIDDAAHRAGHRRNLLPLALRRTRTDRDARARWLLVGGMVLLLLMTGGLTLQNRRDALASLEAQRDAAFDSARRARALRAELESGASAANFLAEQRQRRPTMLELLDDLTRRLPDDVYVQRLSVEQNRVTVSGVARSAGTLVATLQGSPYLKGPALAGAVQQDPRTGRDGFTVVAELVPGGSDAKQP